MKVAELFAGVGGFRLGLERAGWEVVWSNQWEPSTKRQHASEIYSNHFRSGEHVCENIKIVLDQVELGKRSIPDFDLLVGGFPCQDYSVARTLNQAVGIQGKKGVLWWEIFRLIQQKQPRFLFLENVDRLLVSPAHQRGRDFAVMLASLSDLGYLVEWRVVNAADYGFPQKRRRTFIVGRKLETNEGINPEKMIFQEGVIAKALPVKTHSVSILNEEPLIESFTIEGDIPEISANFGVNRNTRPFLNAGIMCRRAVWTCKTFPAFNGEKLKLRDVLIPDEDVDSEYWISDSQIASWRYLKGAKKEERTHKSGFKYFYTEGAIPFPDDIDSPSRTILTGEGGVTPSRFKHIILTPSGRYRRLTPVELERLNGFPDGWTAESTPGKRAFLMGNALVVGVIERIGASLKEYASKQLSVSCL